MSVSVNVDEPPLLVAVIVYAVCAFVADGVPRIIPSVVPRVKPPGSLGSTVNLVTAPPVRTGLLGAATVVRVYVTGDLV